MEKIIDLSKTPSSKIDFREGLQNYMTNVLGDYCKANNLEHMSADDILMTHENLTDDQKLWLKNFIKMWNTAQEVES